MSYTGTKAQSGAGSSLSIGSTPVVIGEISGLSQSGKQNGTDDCTNLSSPAEEFIATLLKPGKWDFTVNRVPGDSGQAALRTAFDGKTNDPYVVTLPKTSSQSTSGDKYSFTALVEEMSDLSEVKPDKKITSKVTLKVSGSITFTAGS